MLKKIENGKDFRVRIFQSHTSHLLKRTKTVQSEEQAKLYEKFHRHKVRKFDWLRKKKPALNTGLYKTPAEIC